MKWLRKFLGQEQPEEKIQTSGPQEARKTLPVVESEPPPCPLPKDVEITVDLGDGIRIEFVLVRPGTFMMGSMSGRFDEQPPHKVTIRKPFYLGRYPVTQDQWQKVMQSNPSYDTEDRHPSEQSRWGAHPVENISWNDTQRFLARLTQLCPNRQFSLPTEAQWEFACRAGGTTDYCYGDDPTLIGEYAWYDDNAGKRSHPVGEKKPNAWGFYDMHGSVWEFCSDWYGASYYHDSPAVDPMGPSSGTDRVLRGGTMASNANGVRCSIRTSNMPQNTNSVYGFRLLCSAV